VLAMAGSAETGNEPKTDLGTAKRECAKRECKQNGGLDFQYGTVRIDLNASPRIERSKAERRRGVGTNRRGVSGSCRFLGRSRKGSRHSRLLALERTLFSFLSHYSARMGLPMSCGPKNPIIESATSGGPAPLQFNHRSERELLQDMASAAAIVYKVGTTPPGTNR
jgi:hypothetical protein